MGLDKITLGQAITGGQSGAPTGSVNFLNLASSGTLVISTPGSYYIVANAGNVVEVAENAGDASVVWDSLFPTGTGGQVWTDGFIIRIRNTNALPTSPRTILIR